jgi:hypothetical protein
LPAIVAAEFDWDLSSLVPRGLASDRGPKLAFRLVVVVGVFAVVAGGTVSALVRVSASTIAVTLVGVGFVIVGLLVLMVEGTWVRRIHLDSTGMEFGLTNDKTRRVSWNDPKLHLFLWDRSRANPSSPGVKGRASRYSIGSWDNIGAAGVIPKAVHDLLLEQCRLHGLTLTTVEVTDSADSGAVRTTVTPGPGPR